MRLPIFFPFPENPPTRFRQMPGHGHGRLAVTLFGLYTIIKLQRMVACVTLPVHQNTIRGLHKSPTQIMIGLFGSGTGKGLTTAGVHRGTNPA